VSIRPRSYWVESGLAKEIIPEDHSAPLYTHELTIAQCKHEHCVCKDCGAVVARLV